MKITTGYIEERLKQYKKRSSIIETTLARVQTYKEALEKPESYTLVGFSSQSDMGSIKGKGGIPSSPVEQEVIREEYNQEQAIKDLKEWIADDLSRIYPIEKEIEQIDGALKSLTQQQRYIVELKYFEKITWEEIAREFSDKYRQQSYITGEGAKKINTSAIKTITAILEPFYSRTRIV